MKKLGVLFFALDDGGSTFYRIIQPAQKLDSQGLMTIAVTGKGDNIREVEQAIRISDILVFSNCASPRMADQFDQIKKIGKTIVMDMNDDMFNLSPYSPHYAKLGTEEATVFDLGGHAIKLWEDKINIDLEANRKRIAEQKEALKTVDLITTTTPYLAEEVYGKFNRTAVLPDMVDCELWKPLRVSYREHYFRLGWRGGYSHYEDLMSVRSSVNAVMSKFPDVKLVMSGWSPQAFLAQMPKDRVETYPFVGPTAWPWHAMCLGLNAAFYPWKNIAFNKGKNNLAWLEWSAAGVPGVYPALSPYSDSVKHGETGMLALSNEGFLENISQLIKDQKLRTKISWQARTEVERHWDINGKIGLWKEAYETCRFIGSQDRKSVNDDSRSALN